MILRLRYRRGGLPVDLEVSLAPDTTAGELVEQLVALDPKPRRFDRAPDCIAVGSGSDQVVVDAGMMILGSPIVSGAKVEVVSGSVPGVGAGKPPKVAELTVIGGPETGRAFPLHRGTYFIGRDITSDIQIRDDTVSKLHAKVIVADGVEIVDNNSSNGVVMGGVSVARATVQSTDAIEIGDSTVVIAMSGDASQGTADVAGAHDFIRSPRISPVFPDVELTAPDIPGVPDAQKLSIVMLVTPLLMGAALFAVTKSPASLLFVLMTPIMGIGQWLESRLGRRRNMRLTTAQFHADLADFDVELRTKQDEERLSRLRETPGGADAGSAIAARSDLLWCRRREDEPFLHLRLGLGAARSRVCVAEPAGNRNEALQRTLRSFIESVEYLPGVPIVADLGACSLGVAGAGEPSLAAARSLLLQVAALHAPEDVTIAACMSSQSAEEWDWLKWLPHAAGPAGPIKGSTIAAGPGATAKLVEAVEELVATRAESLQSAPEVFRGAALVLLVEDDAPIDRARLVGLAEAGPRCGVHLIWHAASRRALPAACQVFVEIDSTGQAKAGFVGEAVQVEPLVVEQARLADVSRHARRLAPVVDSGSLLHDDSDLPAAVSFLSLSDPELARNAAAVADRWRESDSLAKYRSAGARRKAGTLRALLGQASGGPLTLDLRSDGPHALVGGTTGSGKSELLQTWALALAAAHSPERVTFLFVDYKGGSAFGECVELPHSVGLVTDLNPHLVHRALESLNAEVRHREHLLQRARAKDLLDMEKSGHPETPPSLVIVVDEFAALIHEVPEFVEGVVNVAQRGRSLGLHLILATQRPAGVIKDNLRANTNLRVALRMADEEDSTDVLGTALAAGFDSAAPGRAVVRRGPGRLTTFQSAYVGGVTDESGPKRQITITELSLIDPVPWVAAEATESGAEDQPSDLKRLLETITAAARLEEVPEPRKPWLPELPALLDLVALRTDRNDEALVFALRDEPESQVQLECAFKPDLDGNFAIYGAGGSGKSAVLRSLAIAAGMTACGGPVHVYGLDFGARGLQMLEPLPHVGSIIAGEDTERVGRLLRMLRDLIHSRSERYAAFNASSIVEYRRDANAPDEPRIVLLLDGLAGFRQAHDMGSLDGYFELLTSIAADGRQVGVHIVVTADRPATVPSSLNSLISKRLALRLADENDLATLNVPKDLFSITSPPGRGYLDQHEVQVAVLGGRPAGPVQAQAIERFARSMRRNTTWPTAPEVRRLPDDLRFADVPAAVGTEPVLGMSDEDLAPATFLPVGTFAIVGPPSSGRTTALETIVRAVCLTRPGTRTAVFTPARRPGLAWEWDLAAAGPDVAAQKAAELQQQLLAAGPDGPRWLIVVEAPADFLHGPADEALCTLIAAARSVDQFVIGEGDTQSMSGSWQLQQALRFSRRGIALQPDQEDGDMIFKTMFPRMRRSDFPKGRGMLVRDGRARRVQVAWAGDRGM